MGVDPPSKHVVGRSVSKKNCGDHAHLHDKLVKFNTGTLKIAYTDEELEKFRKIDQYQSIKKIDLS